MKTMIERGNFMTFSVKTFFFLNRYDDDLTATDDGTTNRLLFFVVFHQSNHFSID